MKSRFLLLALPLLGSAVIGADYTLSPGAGEDTVYFRSTAKLEFIQGQTTDITGSFTVEADSPISAGGALRVDLRTLRTGIETRDGHMRDKHLHTDKYPYAFFEITGARGLPPTLRTDSINKGTVIGWFYIHGVRRQIEAAVEIARFAEGRGESLRVRTRFDIRLDDFGIPRPRALLFKLAEVIAVECIFTAYSNLPPVVTELPDWPSRE